MFPRQYKKQCNGFSLVEIMVGMVIGMLGILVMMQVFAVFEGQKRTTTGGDDAQNSGAIALYGLQRDIRQSGYGINAFNLIGCNVQLRAGVTLTATAPVTINHAAIPSGDANTDTMLVVYGNSNGSPQGDGITSQPSTPIYAVQTPTSFIANDWVIAEPQSRPSPCNLILDRVASVANPNVTVSTGQANMSGGTLYNVGQAPKILAYAIRSGNLTVCDYTANDCSIAANVGNAAVWVPIANNVVSMRAQYGRDTTPAMDAIVDVYDQTVQVPPAVSSIQCGWIRVSAVRLALVVRSNQYDKNTVTTASPAWAGGATNPIDLTKNPDGTANPDWQHYRYKAFETIVPIRNIVWMGVQSGC